MPNTSCPIHGEYVPDAGTTTCPACIAIVRRAEGSGGGTPTIQRDCLICGMNLGQGHPASPNGGIFFTSIGNYGSRVEDRTDDRWKLLVYVCDICLLLHRRAVLDVAAGYAAVRRWMPESTPWHKDGVVLLVYRAEGDGTLRVERADTGQGFTSVAVLKDPERTALAGLLGEPAESA